MKRIVSIHTDIGCYYESHESFDHELGTWVGEEFFDLTRSYPPTHGDDLAPILEIDVSSYQGMKGKPVCSYVLLGPGSQE